MTAENKRLEEARKREKHWKRWGPYLSERQWGTVREDYSSNGDAWNAFPFEQSHRRAYRWGEDGLMGISDNHQRMCFAVALWNGRDPILKERLFGLTNAEGNHGEDVKEVYYYLDSTPTHSYMKALYKYTQSEFPYAELRARAVRAGIGGFEPEIWDTAAFTGSRYFDVYTEYAKADQDDILIRITVTNRGPDAAPIHVLPTVWFRNRWSGGRAAGAPPVISAAGPAAAGLHEEELGDWCIAFDGAPSLLFTNNESDPGSGPGYYKDAFHGHVVEGRQNATNPAQKGTKMCAWTQISVPAGASVTLRARLHAGAPRADEFADFDAVMALRIAEADEFYSALQNDGLSADARTVQRQAMAGLLWTKQYYHYVVEDWLKGEPAAQRREGRNSEWTHLYADNILSMPDKWEYPWFAAWDTAFHMIPFALLDSEFAKHQLELFLREWFLHPNGQIPAYEWNFSDVNPPVHAWACYRVYKIDAKQTGRPDHLFLERCFHKLLMNFTWWVNRKDPAGHNVFEGGFLGLDNIGVFDRSRPLPTGGTLAQSDGTSWMAMYALNMLRIALELASVNPAYEDIASKFLEHFLYISSAMNSAEGNGLWDEEDGFYYDRLRLPDGTSRPLRVRSLVGLIPLFAVETSDAAETASLTGFLRRTWWFLDNRRDLAEPLLWENAGEGRSRGIIALVKPERLRRVLEVMLDEREFLSPYGIRSLSRIHLEHPFEMKVNGEVHCVGYRPAESDSRMFGGNSNWRGPVWFPINYLIVESLQKFHHYFGDELKVECPTGSGNLMNLSEVAAELSRRMSRIFLQDENGRRPCYGETELFQSDPEFRDNLFFHEYFHGDNGAGLGAIHQTGWTALVAKLLQQSGE